MAAEAFSIVGKLVMDTQEFLSSASQAETHGENLSSKLNKVVSVAKKVAGALVLKKGVQSLKSLADAAAAAGDKIDKQSQALGLSRKAYQEWDYILSQNGSSIDSLGVSMKTLNKSILEGDDSVGKLGLSFDDLSKMDMEQQFEAVVKAFQEMPPGAEKSALAVELFGRNGMQLLPLLNNSATSIDELRQRFEELGIEMSDDMINSAVNYTDAMDTMTRTLDAAKYAIGAELLPVMTDWITKATDYAGKLVSAYKEEGVAGVFRVLDEDITKVTDNMRESGNPVLQALAGIIDGIKNGVKLAIDLFNDFPGTVQKLKESDSAGLRILGAALDVIQQAFQWVMDNQETVVAAITAIVAAFAVGKIASFVANLNPITLILGAIAAAATLIVTNWESIKETVITIWENIKTAVNNAWDAISKWWQSNIAENINRIWSDVKAKLTGWWEAIQTGITDAWNAVTEWWGDISANISAAWGAIASWFSTNVWGPIQTAFTNVWNKVQKIWTNISTHISNAWNSVKSWFETNVTQPIGELFSPLFTTISSIWTGIIDAISSAWSSVVQWFTDNVTGPLSSLFQPVVDAVTSIWNIVSNIFGLNKHTIDIEVAYTTTGTPPPQYTPGGSPGQSVHAMGGGGGVGGGRMNYMNAKGNYDVPYDNYPALLHRNEMVLTASQARRYREGEESGVDYSRIGSLVGVSVERALRNVNVYLGADKVGHITTEYVDQDIKASDMAILRGMGG